MLHRRLAVPAAVIALGLSLILTILGILAGFDVVSIMSRQLIRQMTAAVHRDVEEMIGSSDRSLTRLISSLSLHGVQLTDSEAVAHELNGLLGGEPYVD